MDLSAFDVRVRDRAFAWLQEQVALRGDVLPRAMLSYGFVVEGERIRLVGPQGIFKPRCIELPLSITTVPAGPYSDEFDSGGLLLYKYRGTDPEHRDNVGLRRLMKLGSPLVYFQGIVPGKYLATWPAFVVADNPASLTFTVALDEAESLIENASEGVRLEVPLRRTYATREFRQRLHQRAFRERVLRAYREQCAMCRLRHQELLDAAHIVPDSDPDGKPVVTNGLSLCKLHHAAFDRHFVGVREDYIVEVRPDVLTESDGPMLLHGLQELHGKKLILPRARELRPDQELLNRRYQRFREAS